LFEKRDKEKQENKKVKLFLFEKKVYLSWQSPRTSCTIFETQLATCNFFNAIVYAMKSLIYSAAETSYLR
jgi:hypothetical protein